jgi:acyl-[acyl-carrier-protein]--UDP-N-acetylglucosamine O-acyltransferase
VISKQAIIDPSAKLAPDVEVGPFSVIGANVEIGSGTIVGSHVVIMGPTIIGKNNRFYQFGSIGEDCQDKKYHGENTKLIIGDNNTFRESCTIHRGTIQGGGITSIGNDNLFMVNAHVAHDCIIANHVVFSNNAAIAGHVQVDDYASLGGFVAVHQFCLIGAYSFSGGGSMIMKDVAPFVRVFGNPAQVHGLNTVGLTRSIFSVELMSALKQAYKIVFRTSFTVNEAIEQLNELIIDFPEIIILRDFLKKSERGIIR